ncbi:10 kda heat shock protein, partial [Perkinsus olseni]
MPPERSIILASLALIALISRLPLGDAIGTGGPHPSEDGFPPIHNSSHIFMPPEHETYEVLCSYRAGTSGKDDWSALAISYGKQEGMNIISIACPKIGGREAFEMVDNRYISSWTPGTVKIIKFDPFRGLGDPVLDGIVGRLSNATETFRSVESKTATGVFLPEAAKPTINQAVVMAIGNGRVLNDGTKVPISVQPGDKVIIPEFGGMNLKLDGEDFQVFRDDDI